MLSSARSGRPSHPHPVHYLLGSIGPRIASRVLTALPPEILRETDLGFEAVGADSTAFARLFDETVKTFADIASERQIAAGD